MNRDTQFLPRESLQLLIDAVISNGYDCIGPQVRDGAIIYDQLNSVTQLPRGITDSQSPGHYTLNSNDSLKYFNWANGPQAIKPLLFTAREKLWQSEQSDDGQLTFTATEPTHKPIAILGVRACDIAAMKIQDQHFLQQAFVDPYYKVRRENLLTIAVNCAHPADTCFCHSTGDGPFVDDGADIVLTELDAGYLINPQSTRGEALLTQLTLEYKTVAQSDEYETIKTNASIQKRRLPELDIKTQLMSELNNDAWHAIATKCLSCGNCTSVCPTCFCHSENDVAELNGHSSSHYREWDSCFTQGHSQIHGIIIRSEIGQRYRQWLTHKFSTWHEQYGRSGCVGCGRCIAWCPVEIDVIESITQVVERRRG